MGRDGTEPEISKLLHEKSKSADKTINIYDEFWHSLLGGAGPDLESVAAVSSITHADASFHVCASALSCFKYRMHRFQSGFDSHQSCATAGLSEVSM